tara:strand:- start:53 stop:1786 length:1734 start_codon:yes stop_codon:yes gene_type:complete
MRWAYVCHAISRLQKYWIPFYLAPKVYPMTGHPQKKRAHMTNRLYWYGLLSFLLLPLLMGVAVHAEETQLQTTQSELLLRLDEQQRVIEGQNQRIERLEEALKQLVEPGSSSGPAKVTGTGSANEAASQPTSPSQSEPPKTPSPPARTKEANSEEAAEDPFAGKSAPKKGYDPEKSFFGPLPRFKSASGYSFGFSGVISYDVAGYSQDGENGSTDVPDFRDGSKVKSASMGLVGVFPKDWIWGIFYDFADTDAAVIEGLRSAFALYRGFEPWWIILGQQNAGTGLDASNFSTQRVFMEEAMSAGAFAFAPGAPTMGISTLYRQNNKYIRLGLMSDPAKKANSVAAGALGDEPYGIHARFAWAPVAERTRALHIGTSGYWRKPDGTGFSSDPEVALDSTKLIDTGQISRAKNYYFAGLEGALVSGPFSAQGEYGLVNITRKNNQSDQAQFKDLGFDGYYVQASYFLTGESRNYYPRFAAFWRVKPKHDFSLENGTWGAWELGLRYSVLDLDDEASNLPSGGVRGGAAENYTLGLNWYLNPFVRAQLNYVHTDVENLTDSGLAEGDVVHIIGTRFQIEY